MAGWVKKLLKMFAEFSKVFFYCVLQRMDESKVDKICRTRTKDVMLTLEYC